MNKNSSSKFFKKNFVTISSEQIKQLKFRTSKQKYKKYRYCLHNSIKHLTQEMIICTKDFVYSRPHKHPKNSSKSYHIIEGSMDIMLFSEKGKLTNIIKLSSKNKKDSLKVFRLSKSIYHTMIPTSKWTIWHEVVTGPFIQNSAKFSKLASFAPTGSEETKILKNYILDKIYYFKKKK